MAKKSPDKAPAFQFYPDKWESHTAHLSDYSYRIYHRIICWMWQHSEDKCSIQANDGAIATVLAQPYDLIAKAMKEINNEHMPLLKKRGNKWVSGGLKKEADKQKIRRKKAQDSARARWGNDLTSQQTQSERNANASAKQCSPSPSPVPIISSNTLNIYMLRIGAWFKRRTSTKWTKKELKALKDIGEIDDEDFDVLEKYYTADISKDDYRRQTIATLLNNWPGELDRARNYKPPHQHGDQYAADREF